jgi:hypothetical protein
MIGEGMLRPTNADGGGAIVLGEHSGSANRRTSWHRRLESNKRQEEDESSNGRGGTLEGMDD